MNRQQHGMLSLVFLSISLLMAFISIGRSSVLLAILYICILGLSGIVLLYSFCSKCMCRDTTCGHVIPGILTRYLPRRMSGRYTRQDHLGTLFPILVGLIYPQYWLLGNLWWWSAFWIFFIAGAVDTRIQVCQGCGNRYCRLLPTTAIEGKKE
ncbi:MAG: hypothetical protein LUO93_01480 [Methanomicrobiales archaeon]|nr:hypothetical protein [Methanomicrobiales archaeon]